MYVTLGVILIVLVWAITAISQMNSSQDQNSYQTQPQTREPFDRNKRRAELRERARERMALREEMHKRIRDKILLGIGDDQDIFKGMEEQFAESMAESLSGLDDFSSMTSNFQSEWLESKTGRTLVITPKDPNQKINIDVNASAITIKGETQTKTGNSTYSSNFTNSFPVPEDCDGTKVKMDSKDGKLLVELPFRQIKAIAKPKPEERKPLPPAGEVQI